MNDPQKILFQKLVKGLACDEPFLMQHVAIFGVIDAVALLHVETRKCALKAPFALILQKSISFLYLTILSFFKELKGATKTSR